MRADPDQLAVAAHATEHVIEGITEHQWDLPTPCTDWNVRDLVGHVVVGNVMFSGAVSGEEASAPPKGSRSVDHLCGAYRQSVRSLIDAFGRSGALEKMITVPFGTVPGAVALHLRITELLVHGWDVAHATGQSASFPSDLCEHELRFARSALADIPAARRPFAPPQPAPDDAPAIERLVACLGRTVSPSTPGTFTA